MHGQFETGINPHQDIPENKFAVSSDSYAHEGFVADSVAKRVFWIHVDMPQCTNHSLVDLDATVRTFQYATRRVRNVAAFADRRMNAQLELLGHRDLDLRVFARGPKDADPFNATFRSDNRQLLLAGVLARLRKVGVFSELMSLAEQ